MVTFMLIPLIVVLLYVPVDSSSIPVDSGAPVNDVHVNDLNLEDELARLRLDNQKLREENVKLRSQVTTAFTPQLFEDNKNILQFYTGLPNWTVFKAVLDLVVASLPRMPNSKLSPFEIIVMFFMKIRLYLVEEDIGYRFGVHQTTVSRNFHEVLDVMDAKLSHLIKWPDCEKLYQQVFAVSSRSAV